MFLRICGVTVRVRKTEIGIFLKICLIFVVIFLQILAKLKNISENRKFGHYIYTMGYVCSNLRNSTIFRF